MVGLLFAVLLFLFSFPVSWLADYYAHLNQFSYGVKSYDRDEAQKILETLKEDYNHFVKWKLQYPADRFLFTKMYLYEAAVSVLNEDYEKVEKDDLKNREGWEANYILGISKFWALHAAFQEAMIKKDKAKMVLILGIVVEQVKSDFEKCVMNGPGPAENFNCSFDYDLTSDPNAAIKALVSPKPQTKYLFGPDGKKMPGQTGDKKAPPQLMPGDKKDAGQGGARKVG
ncbi:MAG: hypothetical protein AAB861_01475 [Patescibacteria group bacterium]